MIYKYKSEDKKPRARSIVLALYRKKKNIEDKIRILRNKIEYEEADSSEPAKLSQLLREEKRIKESSQEIERY